MIIIKSCISRQTWVHIRTRFNNIHHDLDAQLKIKLYHSMDKLHSCITNYSTNYNMFKVLIDPAGICASRGPANRGQLHFALKHRRDNIACSSGRWLHRTWAELTTLAMAVGFASSVVGAKLTPSMIRQQHEEEERGDKIASVVTTGSCAQSLYGSKEERLGGDTYIRSRQQRDKIEVVDDEGSLQKWVG